MFWVHLVWFIVQLFLACLVRSAAPVCEESGSIVSALVYSNSRLTTAQQVQDRPSTFGDDS